jgi:hypothetical protein
LSIVKIPSSVVNIEKDAFSNCTGIKDLIIMGKTKIKQYAF